MAGKARRLLHGRYYRIPGTAEKYYDTIGHRSLSSHAYRTKVRGLEEGHKRQRRIRREVSELQASKQPIPEGAHRREAFRQTVLSQLWANLTGTHKAHAVPDGYQADLSTNRRRTKLQRDEKRIRRSELESSDLFHRIWKGLQNREYTGPNSEYAKALELWGQRPERAWWNVGDTPKVMAGYASVDSPDAKATHYKRRVTRPRAALARQRKQYVQYSLFDSTEQRRDFVQSRLQTDSEDVREWVGDEDEESLGHS